MKKIIFIFILISSNIAFCQSLYSSVFAYKNKSFNIEHFDLRDKISYDYTPGFYYLVGYRHIISKKNGVNIYIQYSQFDPNTGYSLRRNPYTYYIAHEISIISTSNIDIGIQKKINLSQNKFFISISSGLRVTKVKKRWPYNFEDNELGKIYYYAYPGFYFLPQFDFAIDYRIGKCWHIILSKMFTFGIKGHFQDTYFDYTFKGPPIVTTKTYSNGTTQQIHLGLQFDFFRLFKKNRK